MTNSKPLDAAGADPRGIAPYRVPRIIYNDDTCTLRTAPPPHTVESLGMALDYLKGTQVDCLCWCVGEQQMAYSWPSQVFENIYDAKSRQAAEFAGWKNDQDVMFSLHRQGIDYLPLLIQRAHDQDLMFVASFRMNDTHVKSYPNSFLTSEFWKTHQQYRLWGVTDGKSYYNAALDYSFPEVRNRYRDAIAEVAGMYDVDGIELDMCRNEYFFQPDEAWDKREILTAFVREVRDVLEGIGARRGRPLTLLLRIPASERVLAAAGMDVRQWIRERLAPILIVTDRVLNFNQEIEPWRTLCREAGVLLYPAVETGPAMNIADFYSPLIRNRQAPRHDGSGSVALSDEERSRLQRGAAQNLLAQQPDGIAMFNFPCRLAEAKNIMHTDPAAFGRVTSLLCELGDLATLAGKEKRYTFYQDLPIYVEANRPRRFHQTIPFAIRGADIRDATVTLRFRWIAEKNPHADGKFRQNPIVKPGLVKVTLNDREIPEQEMRKTRAPAGRIPSQFLLRTHEIVEFQVPGSALRDGENALAFEMMKPLHERDPYVYVYELEADVAFGA